MAKPAGSQLRNAETPTPDREALEHPHILFSLVRDPMLVALGARGLNEPALRIATTAKKSVSSPAARGRGR
jgi:hypothetical protein